MNEELVALVRPVALTVNCLPLPAALTVRPENVTVPLPAPVPMSRLAVPWSEPVPALSVSVTVLLAPIPTVESLPYASRVFTTGCGLKAEP